MSKEIIWGVSCTSCPASFLSHPTAFVVVHVNGFALLPSTVILPLFLSSAILVCGTIAVKAFKGIVFRYLSGIVELELCNLCSQYLVFSWPFSQTFEIDPICYGMWSNMAAVDDGPSVLVGCECGELLSCNHRAIKRANPLRKVMAVEVAAEQWLFNNRKQQGMKGARITIL